MRRLSGIDSMFLSLESATSLFHVGAIAILDPSTRAEGAPPPHEELARVVTERLHLLAPFRRKLQPVPGGLAHPVWVDDPDFDVWNHIRRGALPAPGGPEQLAAYCAQVLSRPLDRGRPLWELHVVEGLRGGLIAGVAKIHHAAIDGIAGVELTANLMDLTPEVARRAPSGSETATGTVATASPAGLALASLLDAAGLAALGLATAARTAATAAGMWRANRRPATGEAPGLLDAPPTPLSGPITSERSIGLAVVDRCDVEAIRAKTGTTFNDVILAVTASALRGYLLHRRGLPDRSLVAFVPMAARPEGARSHDDSVNQLSGFLASLATSLDDPVDRLLAIHASAARAKEQDRVVRPLLPSMAQLGVPALGRRLGRLLAASGASRRKPGFNVVVSTFPASPCPLYCAGSELLAYHPLGPVAEGSALNVTAASYRDQVSFGVTAAADVMPDADWFAHLLGDATTELVKATATGTG